MTPLNHFDIRLTPQELDIVANALAEAPWKFANPVLTNIKSQVDMQQKIDQMRPVGPQEQQELSLQPTLNGHAQ